MTKGDNGPMRQGHVNGENLLKHDAHKIDGLEIVIDFHLKEDFSMRTVISICLVLKSPTVTKPHLSNFVQVELGNWQS